MKRPVTNQTRRARELASKGHPIRNYLVFAILTISGVIAASFVFGSPAATAAACRITGTLTPLTGLSEASGVVVSRRNPGVLWTLEDQGKPLLVALDAQGKLKGRVQVTGASVENWEDLAIAPCKGGSCLYIADIGDNGARRKHISVYRVPEPSPSDAATAAAEVFQATYPDGPRDAEALIVSKSGGVFVVTKGNTGPSALYRFPEPLNGGSNVQLQRVGVLTGHSKRKDERVTGASTSPDGRWVALRTHDAVLFYDSQQFLSGSFGRPLLFDMSSLGEPQGEGVALGPEGAVFLVSEGGGKGLPGSLARGACQLTSGAP